MGRIGGRDDSHFRQVERAQNFLRGTQMAVMDGIESAAKNAEGFTHKKYNRQD